MTDKLNSQQQQKRSIVLLRPACTEYAINPMALLPMFELHSWCEYREGRALNSHGRLYTCDSEVGASRSGLRVIHSSQAEADFKIWCAASWLPASLRAPAGLQTSLGCEGDGLTPPTNLAATSEDRTVYKQLGDNYFASVNGIPLLVAAQRALYALDNAQALSPCPLYNDAAAELRAALRSPAGIAGGNKP